MADDPAAAKRLPLDADPWLWWQQLRGVLLKGTTLPGYQLPKELPVLAQRREGARWPRGLKLAKYYRQNRIGTGLIANDRGTLERVRGQLLRMKVARPIKEQLFDAMPAIGAGAADLLQRRRDLTGKRVVIGFVDNGCAFAHPNFVKDSGVRTRVERLWDQGSSPEPSLPWLTPTDFDHGREIVLKEIDLRTGTRNPPEKEATEFDTPEEVYDKLEYALKEVVAGVAVDADVTHGTHVMDIAAGSGPVKGMAPDADLIFVQLPQSAILQNTDQASVRHLLDGVAYVFARAGDRPAVVNISYNAYTGPHDGTSLLEAGLDELLQKPGRAVVISAANARDKKCHATGELAPEESRSLSWEVHVDDDTENFIEIWYPGVTEVKILTTPPGTDPDHEGPWIGPGEYCKIMVGKDAVGAVIQRGSDPGNGDNQALITVNPTVQHPRDARALEAVWKEAPAGTWKVNLKNVGTRSVTFHAWIERDDRGRNPQAEQSCFADSDAVEEGTLGGLCTGSGPIVVGAYNSATGALETYSSAGPTVDGRQKPDICAPGASDPNGFGILAAAARTANPARLNGTSMSAPVVTGLIALMFELAKLYDQLLDIDTVRQMLARTAVPLAAGDPAGTGPGRIDVAAALDLLDRWLQARQPRPPANGTGKPAASP
jgi:subtilisin family serine protease